MALMMTLPKLFVASEYINKNGIPLGCTVPRKLGPEFRSYVVMLTKQPGFDAVDIGSGMVRAPQR